MAKLTQVTINDTTPTLVFSGEGLFSWVTAPNVPAPGGAFFGDASVPHATGVNVATPMRLESTDKVYAVSYPGYSTTLNILHTR